MVKGVSIKFSSYHETVPKLLNLIKFEKELQKHDKIVLKIVLDKDAGLSTPPQFVEEVLRFCTVNKKPGAQVFIADGTDGADTMDLFEIQGYKKVAEQYSVGLIDLNSTEVEEIVDDGFIKFQNVMYPKLLLEGFVIALPKLSEHPESEMQGSISIMAGAYPARYYSRFFSNKKSKIKKWPIKYSIHDIIRCKMPEFAIMDASAQGAILAGIPLEIDKQAAKLLGKDWKNVGYLRLISESKFHEKPVRKDLQKESASPKEEPQAEPSPDGE